VRKGYAFPVAKILLGSRKIGTANDSKIELVLFAFSVVLTINLTPMSDAVNTHDLDILGDLVDDPVIAHAYSPVIICSGKLPATMAADFSPAPESPRLRGRAALRRVA